MSLNKKFKYLFKRLENCEYDSVNFDNLEKEILRDTKTSEINEITDIALSLYYLGYEKALFDVSNLPEVEIKLKDSY